MVLEALFYNQSCSILDVTVSFLSPHWKREKLLDKSDSKILLAAAINGLLGPAFRGDPWPSHGCCFDISSTFALIEFACIQLDFADRHITNSPFGSA